MGKFATAFVVLVAAGGTAARHWHNDCVPKPLPMNEIRARAAEFARRWAALMDAET